MHSRMTMLVVFLAGAVVAWCDDGLASKEKPKTEAAVPSTVLTDGENE